MMDSQVFGVCIADSASCECSIQGRNIIVGSAGSSASLLIQRHASEALL